MRSLILLMLTGLMLNAETIVLPNEETHTLTLDVNQTAMFTGGYFRIGYYAFSGVTNTLTEVVNPTVERPLCITGPLQLTIGGGLRDSDAQYFSYVILTNTAVDKSIPKNTSLWLLTVF